MPGDTYRVVASVPLTYGGDDAKLIAELVVFSEGEVDAAYGTADLLTGVLHMIPFGTAADACAGGEVSVEELVLNTIGDVATLGGAFIAKASVLGATKPLVQGRAAIQVARGVTVAGSVSAVGNAGMAVADVANNDADQQTFWTLAKAAVAVTAAIFGVKAVSRNTKNSQSVIRLGQSSGKPALGLGTLGAGRAPRKIPGYGWTDANWWRTVKRIRDGDKITVRSIRIAAELRRDAFPGYTRSRYRGLLGQAPDGPIPRGSYDWHDPAKMRHHPDFPHVQIKTIDGKNIKICVDPKNG